MVILLLKMSLHLFFQLFILNVTQLCCYIIVVVIIIRGRVLKNEEKVFISRRSYHKKGETCKASIYAYQSIKLKLKQLLRHVAGASRAKEEISRTRERRKGEEKTLVSHLHPQNNLTVLHQLSKNMIERRSSSDKKATYDLPGRIVSCTTNRNA